MIEILAGSSLGLSFGVDDSDMLAGVVLVLVLVERAGRLGSTVSVTESISVCYIIAMYRKILEC